MALLRLWTLCWLFTLCAAVLIQTTPPLGWNSYDAFTCTVTEEEVKSGARNVAKYLQPSGYNYVVVDYEWFRPGVGQFSCCQGSWDNLVMDEYGRLLPSTDRFPSAKNGTGFKALADYVHSLGLKFGIHIMRGIPRVALQKNTPVFGTQYFARDVADTNAPCRWCVDMWGVKDTPAGMAYYKSIVDLYSSWGVDFIKMDCVFGEPLYLSDIQAVSQQIANNSRPMVFSLSPGEDATASEAQKIKNDVTIYRISDDVWDNWPILNKHFQALPQFLSLVGEPSFPDSDMLPLGYLSVRGGMGPARYSQLTHNEQRTLMTLWALTRSPLIFGGDPMMLHNDTWTVSLLTNPEVLDVNQKSTASRLIRQDTNSSVWSSKFVNSSKVFVGLFNQGEVTQSVEVKWGELTILKRSCHVRDVWERSSIGIRERGYTKILQPHQSQLVEITNCH